MSEHRASRCMRAGVQVTILCTEHILLEGSEDDIFKSAFYDDFLFVAKIQIPLLKSYNLQNMNT